LGAEVHLKQKPWKEIHILQAQSTALLFEGTPPRGRWARGTYMVIFNIRAGCKTEEQFLCAVSVVRNRDCSLSALLGRILSSGFDTY